MTWTLHQGDVLDRLRELPDGSVHCVVTSPPYWGLRDYGVDGQIGLEPTPGEYVARIVEVFGEVRRVLRADGTVWLNLGDSYNNRTRVRGTSHQPGLNDVTDDAWADRRARGGVRMSLPTRAELKEKDLVGIPWRVAFALQADGWWLRSDIVWSKPNPMPESVADRPTRSHEYLFLLAKSARYFYDADAIREPSVSDSDSGNGYIRGECLTYSGRGQSEGWTRDGNPTRNRRSVWSIATQPYRDAHFATFPEQLVEPCVLAGTSTTACGECGAPWHRLTEPQLVPGPKATKTFVVDDRDRAADANDQGSNRQKDGHRPGWRRADTTVGWEPTCDHDDPSGRCVVLDPFAGSGTTLMVAERLGRDSVGVELNPEYVQLARRRIVDDSPLLNTAAEGAA